MKQIKQILLALISTTWKILNGFDERKVLKQGDTDIEYGIIHGNSTIVFIKAGLLGSYRGYKNKYLKIAKRLNRNHRCTVITASNPNGYYDDFDSEMKFLKDYAYQYNLLDYQIYYMGHSNGASLGIIHAYKYPEIKKLVCINGPLNINLLSLTSGIRKFHGEKMNLVYCSNDFSFSMVNLFSELESDIVEITKINGADHNFSKCFDLFMALPGFYFFGDKIKCRNVKKIKMKNTENHNEQHFEEMLLKEKIRNTLLGAIVADALGVPFEGMYRNYLKKTPVTDMTGHGSFNLPKGSWSDDSSMTLCLAESIGRLGKIDYDDIMRNFYAWLRHSKFTPDHKSFGVGLTCSKAITNYRHNRNALKCGLSDEQSNGNGSLMRISSLPLYLFQKFGDDAMINEESFEIIHNVSSLTHAHKISLIGCDIYCAIMIEILNGTKKESLQGFALPKIGAFVRNHSEYNEDFQKYERIFHLSFKDISEDQIKSSGYVVDTLEAALWCYLNTNNYRDCVLKAVNLGHDADTVACVAGSIAGLYYGNIPAEWINQIRNKRLINKIIDKFSNCLEKSIPV